MPLQKGIQNNVSEFNSFAHKLSYVQKNGMHMTEYILIRRNFLYDSALLDLTFFLFIRNLRIDKNYTLSIFMLSGSIQFYSNFQFNTTCIYHKTMPVFLYISNYTHAYSFPHAFTLQNH